MHWAFNNFHLADTVIDNVWNKTKEHYIQNKEAALFDNDVIY